jgi:hypothetical protein
MTGFLWLNKIQSPWSRYNKTDQENIVNKYNQYFTKVLQENPILGCVAGVRSPHTPKSGLHQPFRDLLIMYCEVIG